MYRKFRLIPKYLNFSVFIQNNVLGHEVLHDHFSSINIKVALIHLLPFGIENRPGIQRSVTVVMIAGTHRSFLVVPVHYFDAALMCGLRIENSAPFPIQVIHLAAAVAAADLPIRRDLNLIKISGTSQSPLHMFKISQKCAIH